MRVQIALVLVVLAAVALGAERACVSQPRITGRATITDGDSFEIGSTRIRLFGVDAPEGRQACTRDEREYSCGDEAARTLRRLVGDRPVTCTQRDIDDYGRIVAVCRSGAIDLAAEMARLGFATAYRRYSSDYVDEETEARAARRGIWAGTFTQPEQYRRDGRTGVAPAQRERSAPSAPLSSVRGVGCYIKGNINGAGDRIYHVPDSASYENTGIDENRGERWFCTEAEARAAGWRAPR